MLIETIALAAALTACDPTNNPGFSVPGSGTRSLATPAPHYVNGRLWVGRPIIGNVESVHAHSHENPGAAAYGAVDDGQRVYALIGDLAIGISPWQRWENESYPRFEAARDQWLAENGYTGGVRTFVNDANYVRTIDADGDWSQPRMQRREIRPRGVIELPADMPRYRSRMRVDAGFTTTRVAKVIGSGAVVAAK